ncbi:MAG: HD domain-containing protein [Spirochaetales bacterium]|nr:HD domain-containing protein [Spirochaetales bacterium]
MENGFLGILENLCALNGKLEAIVESSTNGIAEIDKSGRFLAWNPSFLNILRIHRKELEDENIFDYIKPQGDFSLNGLEKFHENQSVHLQDLMFLREDSKGKFFLELKLVPLNISPYVDFIVIVKDKSEILTALHNRERFITTLLDMIEDIKLDNRKTIYNLATLVELRDSETGMHLERVEAYTKALATEYFQSYGARDKWVTISYVEDMAISSVLHDIGKVGISDSILLKPAGLSELEMDAMKEHTSIAGIALEKYKGKKDFLAMGREIALTHHEKWDGNGYPNGLMGQEIPLSGRIVALCDTYDAITSDRPYKEAHSHETACRIIIEERGKAFDPEIVDLFRKIHKDFKNISLSMRESTSENHAVLA